MSKPKKAQVLPTEVKELNPQQRQAVLLLAQGMTGRETASRVGVTEETVSRWRSQPEFAASLNRCFGEAIEVVQNRLRSLAGDALGTIEEVMRDQDAPPAVRLSAATALLRLLPEDAFAITKVGPTDAQGVVTEQEIAARDAWMRSLSAL